MKHLLLSSYFTAQCSGAYRNTLKVQNIQTELPQSKFEAVTLLRSRFGNLKVPTSCGDLMEEYPWFVVEISVLSLMDRNSLRLLCDRTLYDTSAVHSGC